MYNVCIMSSVLLTIKVDKQTKQDLKAFANELGITSTALVNMVLRQTLRDKKITVSTDLEPTPYLVELMKEAEAEYKAGETIHTKSPAEALAHIDSLISK